MLSVHEYINLPFILDVKQVDTEIAEKKGVIGKVITIDGTMLTLQ
jgi:hypothetical protein